jgi:membrane fusion protein (multidrug efflux system)
MADQPDVIERPADKARADRPIDETRADRPMDEARADRPTRAPVRSEATNHEDNQDDAKSGKPAPARKRFPWGLVILGLVLIAAAIGGGVYWFATRDLQSTDDAFTDGRAITIAPQVKGLVVDLLVNDNQFVKAGQKLIQIDPRDYIAARDQAEATLGLAQAQLANARLSLDMVRVTDPAKLRAAQAQVDANRAVLVRAQADYRRQHNIDPAATTRQSVDDANATNQQAAAQVALAEAQVKQADVVALDIAQGEAQVRQLQAQVAQAQAQLDQARLNLSYTDIIAPQDGWITQRRVERGNYVQVGASIFSIVSPQVWVTANFKETELTRMRPGQEVDISVDAYPTLKLRGHVDSVQLGSGSKFSAFPAENATGNYVKIVQRVPVKIDIDSGLDPNIPLPLGISVDPTVHLK